MFPQIASRYFEGCQRNAKGLDERAKRMRTTIFKFSNSTAICSDLVHLKRLASLPDVALESIGEIFKQIVATLTILGQELLNILTLFGQETRWITYDCYHGVDLPSVHEALGLDHPRVGC